MMKTQVPFLRPSLGEQEIEEVVSTLRSGWLTSGPRVLRFENEFAAAVNASHAIAVNSCTAALHLAVEALGLMPGQAVLVPTMTFAATAEIIRYQGAVPILVDCDPQTCNMDLDDAERKLQQVNAGQLTGLLADDIRVVGMIPVHVGGMMMDIEAIQRFAEKHSLWVVEDAAHAFPAAYRRDANDSWRRCGENTATVTCYSFYANKTITTGEGGMAVTNDSDVADRIRLMSLHGLSNDAWGRYTGGGNWDYKILAAGYKYNLTDIAAAIGIHQLRRAEEMRLGREAIAKKYIDALQDVDEIELPVLDDDRIQSWHLFPLKLKLDRLAIDRDAYIVKLNLAGVGCSVHWRPLHLHPYYIETYGWNAEDFPAASSMWPRLVSLPIFPAMSASEIEHVVAAVKNLCREHSLSESLLVA